MADPVNVNSGNQGNDDRNRNTGLKAVGLVAGGILLLLIGLGLGWYFFYRVQVNVTVQAPPAPPPPVAPKPDPAAVKALEEQLEKQRQSNKAIEDQIARLRRALEGNVCTITDPRGLGLEPPPAPGGPQSPIPPGGTGTIPGTPGVAPTPKGTAVDPKPPQPPSLKPDPKPDGGATAPKPDPNKQDSSASTAETAADLVPILENATVLILAPTQQGGLSSGTGFFVTRDTIVTNSHVINEAVDGKVLLTSRKLGMLLEGRVTAAVGGGTPAPGSADFAIVRITDTVPAHIKPLGLSIEPAALKEVVAAGYPSAVLRNDANWVNLLKGDPSKAPELIVTKGNISAIQNRDTGMPAMPHTASISGGNSGGPLIDMCGRVVGINTFVSQAQAGAGGLFALGATGISQFLRSNGVTFDWAGVACGK